MSESLDEIKSKPAVTFTFQVEMEEGCDIKEVCKKAQLAVLKQYNEQFAPLTKFEKRYAELAYNFTPEGPYNAEAAAALRKVRDEAKELAEILYSEFDEVGYYTPDESRAWDQGYDTGLEAAISENKLVPHWQRAGAGRKFDTDTLIIPFSEPNNPRLVRCAVDECWYIPVAELKKLSFD